MKGNDNAVLVMGAIMVGGILTNKSPVTLDEVVPLARLTIEYNAIAVAPNSPFKTVKDLTDALKADPGKVAVAADRPAASTTSRWRSSGRRRASRRRSSTTCLSRAAAR